MSQKSEYPWRENPTPYRVWISEVMLQQTQVSRAVDYFSRWMECLPDLEAVSKAKEDELYKLWEGLGYYSRVRNIQKGALYILQNHGGVIPDTVEELLRVPGLGFYTANAIICFAMHKKAHPLDANVVRILARMKGYRERVDTSLGKKYILDEMKRWIPDDEPHLVAEGLIEFGQKVCKKKPRCETCILRNDCKGRAVAEEIPHKKPQPKTIRLEREVAILLKDSSVLIYREEGSGVMQGLWQFPYGDAGYAASLCCKKHFVADMAPTKHGFTRYQVTLHPKVFLTETEKVGVPGVWVPLKELYKYTFSSGHRTLAHAVCQKKFIDTLRGSFVEYSA